MNLSSMRVGAAALVAAMSLAACDAGNVLLWPWVESDKTADADAPPPPPPPLSPVDPLDPDATQTADAVPNPNANTGAPTDGTPFSDGKPENPNIDTGDASPPVSAETGEELPPLPVPTEEASTPTTPAEPPVTTPETPPTTTPTPTPVPASFYYFRPGNLAPSSGTGALEAAALVPDMAFPIKGAPAIAQTQVYRYGG
ncbi:MAG: hypothetical protein Q8R02_07605, partial [Hyphomonadaceae bacterium]|nr:hypothetical protein [Hyphomonadaceae bacterium]